MFHVKHLVNLTEVKNMTKREQAIVRAYLESQKRNLSQCYSSFSEAKREVYKSCVHEYLEDNGKDMRIISYNFSIFTVGYVINENDKQYLVRITPSKKEKIEL